jgi:hypothetical protein
VVEVQVVGAHGSSLSEDVSTRPTAQRAVRPPCLWPWWTDSRTRHRQAEAAQGNRVGASTPFSWNVSREPISG